MFLYYEIGFHQLTVHISNCKFYNGNSTTSGGGLALYWREAKPHLYPHLDQEFIVEHCTFRDNVAEYGSGVYVHADLLSPLQVSVQVIVSNVWNTKRDKNLNPSYQNSIFD